MIRIKLLLMRWFLFARGGASDTIQQEESVKIRSIIVNETALTQLPYAPASLCN